MYARSYWFLAFCFLLLTAGCIDDELQQNQNDDVVADLAFAVTRSSKPSTRMTSAVVQDAGQPYRGITIRQIVPFAVTGKITVNDLPKRFFIVSDGEKPVNDRPYYYYNDCSIMRGVNAFLSYGRATQASTDKHINGCLVEAFPVGMEPKDIRFSLESIYPTIHQNAEELASYMTKIAKAEGNGISWKNAPDATMRLMYMNFVYQIGASSSGEILPGSATDIKAYTQALKNNLNALTLTNADDIAIRTAIINKIETEYNNSWDNFPASIGLPDGAIVIRWDGEKFVPQLTYTSFADINGIDRFAYPAELYYYGNSRIKTSNIDNRRGAYTDREWSDVLADYEYDNASVNGNTQAVAIKDPLQYGVAHLQIALKMTDTSVLKDARGINVPVGTENFPLTGIIVGGQLPVGFDFSPNTSYPVYSEGDVKFIYDNQLPTLYLSSSAHATEVTNTLVLQSYDHQKVPVLLEFINNSGVDFKGQDGIVYQGTKFYLAGEVDPADGTGGDTSAVGRVFTQDHTTTLNMKVTSLAKAYNVVPNLLSPRLELGIELVPKWTSTTPEEIVL
ncbi:MAG: hypothetical protein IJJ68_07480 [Prevotella sp.]|nr:hypothetical protein [Prevotella sp.]